MPIIKDRETKNKEFVEKFATSDIFEEEGGEGAFVFKSTGPMKRFDDRIIESESIFKSSRFKELGRITESDLDLCKSQYGNREWNEELMFLKLTISIMQKTGKRPLACTRCMDINSYEQCDQLQRYVLMNIEQLTTDDKELIEPWIDQITL